MQHCGGPGPRRSREMTHLCSFKVTHTKNTIWRRARISEAISSTPQACGVVFHHPRRSVRKVPIFYEEFRAQVKPINRWDRGGGLATDLPAGKKPFLPAAKRPPYRRGVGLLLASKLWSFLVSAEATAGHLQSAGPTSPQAGRDAPRARRGRKT